jgi:tetratricopeptide (TPR) repeat protein
MGKPEDAEDYVQRALQAAGSVGDLGDEAIAHIILGTICSKRGNLPGAEREVRQALVLARKTKNMSLETAALSNLAAYQAETDAQSAVETYREVLRLRRQGDERSAVANSLTNMGDVLFRRGDLSAAQKNYQEALQIDTQLKDKDSMAHDWVSMADIDFEHGDLAPAEQKLSQAIQQFREAEDGDAESEAASIQVRVLIAGNRAADAAPYVKRIQEIATTDQEGSFDSRLSIAEYLHASGKQAEAIQQIASLPEDAKRAGRNFAALEARLELVKLLIGQRPPADLRKELSSIQAEASHAGFTLLVERARSLRL